MIGAPRLPSRAPREYPDHTWPTVDRENRRSEAAVALSPPAASVHPRRRWLNPTAGTTSQVPRIRNQFFRARPPERHAAALGIEPDPTRTQGIGLHPPSCSP